MRRPEWGNAALAWTREDKRAYQFEDGELRVFAESHLHLLEPTGATAANGGARERRLLQEARLAKESRLARQEAARQGRKAVSFEEQLQRLLRQFGGGLQDASWRTDIRGQDQPRRLKRHREPAVAEAKELLSAEALGAMLEAGQHTEIWERAVQVMRGTDLIAPSQLKPVSTLEAERHADYAEALVELLHGSDAVEHRMNGMLQALRSDQSNWPLATVLLALVFPELHVCVRPAAFRTQARWMLPGLKVESRPSGMQYAALLQLAQRVQRLLDAAGQAPRDYIDVHDFIRITTSHSA